MKKLVMHEGLEATATYSIIKRIEESQMNTQWMPTIEGGKARKVPKPVFAALVALPLAGCASPIPMFGMGMGMGTSSAPAPAPVVTSYTVAPSVTYVAPWRGRHAWRHGWRR